MDGVPGRFAGKVALVTGGNSGLGFATASALARLGAHVMLAARRCKEGEAAVASIRSCGAAAAFVETDVTAARSVVWLASDDSSSYINGVALPIDGGTMAG